MKVANEKVWADAKGNLVADGDESAAVLVAAAGQTVADSHVEQYKNAGKFFKDAVFDTNAQPVMPKVIAPAKVEPPPTIKMVDNAAGPQPQNREQAMPKRKTRGKKAGK